MSEKTREEGIPLRSNKKEGKWLWVQPYGDKESSVWKAGKENVEVMKSWMAQKDKAFSPK